MFALFVVLLFGDLAFEAGATDYCKITCGRAKHTMCLYPESGPSKACKDYVAAPITDTDKKLILDRHNTLRQKVAKGQEKRGGSQPPASNMHKLEWDDELAEIAQRWADQCSKIPHDSCRKTDRFSAGQNKASSFGRGTYSVEQFVTNWYNEVDMMKKRMIPSFGGKCKSDKVGHYTQLVWATTKLVGCGRLALKKEVHLICNYGPAGNVNTMPIYKVGKAGTACPKGVSNMDGLCA